ncbi:MAG TPA: radical SAM protein [Patescibacteria group bacterium]|nr:radical SAM protein [Patescibacteria group bacterium]
MNPYIIPLFIPHYGCRHQCSFCNQKSITGVKEPVSARQVEAVIQEHLARPRRPRPVEVAFYGGSFTALEPRLQQQLLEPAACFLTTGRIQAIRLSTRPDCLEKATIENLRQYGVTTVEMGVQSLDDKVLALAERGHSAEVVAAAAQRLRQAGLSIGIQLMPGLPGEDWPSLIGTVWQTAKIRPDFVRIYPTLVLTGTALADWFRAGRYLPLSLDDAVQRCAYMKLYFSRQGIPVIRTGLQDTEELRQPETIKAGPFHPAFGEMVEAELYYIMLAHCLEKAFDVPAGAAVDIWYPVREGSKMRGVGNHNVQRLKQRFALGELRLHPENLPSGQFVLQGERLRYVINKNMICQI